MAKLVGGIAAGVEGAAALFAAVAAQAVVAEFTPVEEAVALPEGEHSKAVLVVDFVVAQARIQVVRAHR